MIDDVCKGLPLGAALKPLINVVSKLLKNKAVQKLLGCNGVVGSLLYKLLSGEPGRCRNGPSGGALLSDLLSNLLGSSSDGGLGLLPPTDDADATVADIVNLGQSSRPLSFYGNTG
jgi:hypothetical protein